MYLTRIMGCFFLVFTFWQNYDILTLKYFLTFKSFIKIGGLGAMANNHSDSRSTEKLRIYNLFPKLAGNMTSWLLHIPRIAAMGFNAVYVNPFHYPGFSGSLYSPSDYYRFNPQFVDERCSLSADQQLKTVIDTMHGNGMKFIMDLVINHTAIDSPLVKQHPEWYVRDEAGKVKNPFAVTETGKKVIWGDLAEIDNVKSPKLDALYKYWLDMMVNYLSLGVDGFRCDAAYQVPVKLWRYLIGNVRDKFPGTVFLAETLGCEIKDVIALAGAGFDYTFSSSKYWDFNEPWLLKQYRESFEKVSGVPSIGFAESHDTPRLFEEMNGYLNAVYQRHQFVSFFSSGLMIPMGFEFGFRKRLNVVNTTPFDWEDTGIDISDFIKKTNETKKKYRVLNEECKIDVIDQANWANVFCFMKTSFGWDEKVLVIVNKDNYNYQNVRFEDLASVFQSEAPVRDISPMYAMPEVYRNFEYNLRPGQVIVLYAKVK